MWPFVPLKPKEETPPLRVAPFCGQGVVESGSVARLHHTVVLHELRAQAGERFRSIHVT